MESPKVLVVEFTTAARPCQALCVYLRSAETSSQIAARRPASFEYGVPSRIEDDELRNLVMPQPETFEYAEERRLFYVALTRASRGVFLLITSWRRSLAAASDWRRSRARRCLNVRHVMSYTSSRKRVRPQTAFSVAINIQIAATRLSWLDNDRQILNTFEVAANELKRASFQMHSQRSDLPDAPRPAQGRFHA